MEVFEKLGASSKLERDEGLELFCRQKPWRMNFRDLLERIQGILLSSAEHGWEKIFGSVTALSCILQDADLHSDDIQIALVQLPSLVMGQLSHEEFRVRIAAGECLGHFCAWSKEKYLFYLEVTLQGIRDNIDSQTSSDVVNQDLTSKEVFLNSSRWKYLETWMQCLKCLILAIGDDSTIISHSITVLTILFDCLQHHNRFIREIGYGLLGCIATQLGSQKPLYEEAVLSITKQLAVGLADNWSQVRLSASIATRQLLQMLHIPDFGYMVDGSDYEGSFIDRILTLLVPPMCLNRYYVAAGVRLYSQDSWLLISGRRGQQLLERYIAPTLYYYVAQCNADNHAVREAACNCIEEACNKLRPEVLRPYLSTVLTALEACFDDESWPVRDGACAACGSLGLHHPFATREQFPGGLENLFGRFRANLGDSIPSVRQGAAMATIRVAMSTASVNEFTLLKLTEAYIVDKLLSVRDQASMSKSFDDQPASNDEGCMQRITISYDQSHTDQIMYSCGSLAPKMKKHGVGGCIGGSFHRVAQAWEITDGCVCLLLEFGNHCVLSPGGVEFSSSALNEARRIMLNCLPNLVLASQYKNFNHHYCLLETVCKSIVSICRGLGKQKLKPFLQDLLAVVMDALRSDHDLTKCAAEDTLQQFAHIFGPNILRGRLEMLNVEYLDLVTGLF